MERRASALYQVFISLKSVMKEPLVSIIILNWNGKKWLQQLLPSLKKITYKPLEVIVVNNGSTDDSAEYIKKSHSYIKILELKKNVGYAGGNNRGVKSATGKYILLMNNDTLVTNDFVAPLVKAMEKDNTIGMLQPQIRSLIDRDALDSVGSYLTSTGFLYHYGYLKSYKGEKYQKQMPVYSIKGACFIMRKNDYMRLGGFDEDFICYVEETDFCHRVWLSGKKVFYFPDSYMYHYGGGDMRVMTKDDLTMLRSFRNRIWSYCKNLSILELIKILPVHILFCEVFILFALLTGKVRHSFGAQMGILACIPLLPKIIKKRKIIQQQIRKVEDKDILPFIFRNPRISYYIYLFSSLKGFKD